MTRNYFVRTFGCQMNEHDSERLSGLLESDGMTNVDSVGEADVVVINTCCIRENADDKFYGTLSQLKNWKTEKDDRQILVAGCLAQKDRDLIRERAPYVDVVIGTHNVHRAAELLEETRHGRPVTEILEEAVLDDHTMFPSALPMRREVSFNAWVTIQIGCDNTCAYCIVPAVRGKEISRPGAEILAEVESLARSGVTQISLIGQNVNSYGRDLSLNARAAGDITVKPKPQFAELLRKVGAVPGISRVRFVSPHPKDMREDTLLAMAETPTVVEHLHYPLQSGSDTVLRLMHRGYTAERYLSRLAQAREMIDDLAVTTDVIVGFPGETEEDFEETYSFVERMRFDRLGIFNYSHEENTHAYLVNDDVPEDVKQFHSDEIMALQQGISEELNQEKVGQTFKCIIDRKEGGHFIGRTEFDSPDVDNEVLIDASKHYVKTGEFVNIRIIEATEFDLYGEPA